MDDGRRQADGDNNHNDSAKDLEALYHPVGEEGQPQGDEHGEKRDGDQVAQHHPHREACRQAAREAADGDGDDARQHAGGR